MSEMRQGVVISSPVIAQIIYVLSLREFQLVVRTEYALAIPTTASETSSVYVRQFICQYLH